MTLEIGLVYGILALALVLFASNRAPVDLVAIGVLLALVLLRVVDATAALRGFSNAAVVTMGAVFVIGAGTTRTGVAHWLGLWMQRAAGRSEARLVALTMVAGGVLSGFMAAIGAAAVMLPAVVAAARGMRAPVSRVLLPLTYAAIIGNMLTLIATPGNLLVDDALNRRGLPPFGLFEFTPIGATVLAVSVAFVVATRRWLLPERAAGAQVDALLPAQRNQHEPYQLQDRLYKVAVPPGSQLAHTTIRESGIGKRFGIIVLAIDRHGHRLVAPGPTAAILPQDELLISARIEDMDRFVAGLGLSALGR
ncbi:MAG: SLC13 family permease, partial [Actinobacteria bacterium]|nr:SLC13 family permease [Actinomycetota bacterium]